VQFLGSLVRSPHLDRLEIVPELRTDAKAEAASSLPTPVLMNWWLRWIGAQTFRLKNEFDRELDQARSCRAHDIAEMRVIHLAVHDAAP
jgi:hypothetical protein